VSEDKKVDPRTTIEYWVALCMKLQEENERLKEKIRTFY
jgi:hypothetical protein